MTVPSHTAPVAVRDLDCALDAVRARGLRLSMARRVVVEAVFTAPGPVTAEEIARSGRRDLASVYRNLEALEAIGLIRHLHVGHAAGLYLPAAMAVELVVCERCGARSDIDPRVSADVRAAIREATGFSPRFHHFPLAGLCPRCAAGRPER